MSKELVISSTRHETRVALLDDDQLMEVYFQRANEYSLAGSIHKGRVTRVLPGMQSAFVDLGLERDTFLYVSDFLEEHEDEDIDPVTSPPAGGEDRARRDRDRGRDRERVDRDRGDRDRDRRREQSPRVQAVQEPPAAQESGEALSSPDTSETIPQPISEPIAQTPQAGADGASVSEPLGGPSETNGAQGIAPATMSAPAGSAPQGGEHRDFGDRGERRGRRSRRRRRGAQGIPESKYTSGNAPAVRAPEPVARQEESRPAEIAPVTVSMLSPLPVLPGESLRKYRGAPAGPVPAERAERIEDVETVESTDIANDVIEMEFDQAVDYPPENALPDAPMHVLPEAGSPEADSPEAALSEVLSESESSEPDSETPADEARRVVVPPPLPPHAFAGHPAALEGIDDEEAGEEGEDDPAVASILDEDEDRDIQAMILGEAEGIDVVEEPGDAGAGQGEAPAEPASGTAEVRERGGRYPHRVASRRMRRRGRGDRGPGDRGPVDRGPSDRSPGDRAPVERGLVERGPGERSPSERSPSERGPEPREAGRERTVARPVQDVPSIADLLKEGQEIIVQIAKEPLGQKGARITSHIALPGRYVVYMPTLEHMGVSRKIASDEERQRLKRILMNKRPGTVGGFITRTAAEGRSEEDIAQDMEFLYKLWQDIRTKAERRPAPMLLHHDLDIVQRILRDQLADSFKAIWIDNEEAYENVLRFVERFQPALVGKVKLYTRAAPIFDAFGVTQELEKALRPKVWLKSGGYIVINQTEALVAIDVNTGKFVGKSNRLEDTIVKTNTEAIKEIVRQIRLRDLGGIIVIDFIDMDERKNRTKVMQVLEETMRVDRAPYKILQFNDFGLVAITRKRVKQSLERTLCSPCPHCDGAGYIKSVQTVVTEILAEAHKMASSVEGKDVMLRVHPDVAKVLKSHQNKYLEELEEVLRRPVLVKSDPQLHHEKFDLA